MSLPFGSTEPVNVADVVRTFEAEPVVTAGLAAASVANDVTAPSTVPVAFVATSRT